MKRKTSSGQTEYSVSSLTITIESTDLSTMELNAVIADLVSHSAFAQGMIRVSSSISQEVIGTSLVQSLLTFTYVSFKSNRNSVSAEREAIQPPG